MRRVPLRGGAEAQWFHDRMQHQSEIERGQLPGRCDGSTTSRHHRQRHINVNERLNPRPHRKRLSFPGISLAACLRGRRGRIILIADQSSQKICDTKSASVTAWKQENSVANANSTVTSKIMVSYVGLLRNYACRTKTYRSRKDFTSILTFCEFAFLIRCLNTFKLAKREIITNCDTRSMTQLAIRIAINF